MRDCIFWGDLTSRRPFIPVCFDENNPLTPLLYVGCSGFFGPLRFLPSWIIVHQVDGTLCIDRLRSPF
jgi:hypothetical protein